MLTLLVAQGQATSSNFAFLAKRNPQLERIGALSERYFSDDPVISLIRVRQFGDCWLNWWRHALGFLPMRTGPRFLCTASYRDQSEAAGRGVRQPTAMPE